MAKDPYKRQVGERLRLTAEEFGMATTQALASYLDAERGRVDAWLNGRALIPVRNLFPFLEHHRLTLDWFYRGDLAGVPMERAIRLRAASDGTLPPEIEPEIEPEPIPTPAPNRPPAAARKVAIRKAVARPGAASRLPRKS